MINQELEKEAEGYAREWLYHVKDEKDDKPEYIRIKEAYLAGAEPREKRIIRLMANLANVSVRSALRIVKHKKQLTRAKEHIENLLYYIKQCTCERSNYAEIEKDIKEAEQFLKEVNK